LAQNGCGHFPILREQRRPKLRYQPIPSLQIYALTILERDKQRLALPYSPAAALKSLNAGALTSNLKITKGGPVLYFSEVSKQHFLIHARSIAESQGSVVRIGCSRWSGTFERSAIERPASSSRAAISRECG
jgi:hypothetical protein